MTKQIKPLRLTIPTLALTTLSTAAYAHPGDHSGDLGQLASHVLSSPWHMMGFLVALLLTAGLIWVVARHR